MPRTLDRIRQDLRYAWRGLRRTPGFTAVAILTLALGIGANTTFFGLVDAIVFRPTAVARLDRVYELTGWNGQGGARAAGVRYSDAWALEAHTPDSVAAATLVGGARWPQSVLVQIPGRAEYVLGETVSSGYATVFGLHAQSGRWFQVEDNYGRGAEVVVISDRLWRQWFHADPDIAGRATVTFQQQAYRVIGVAPAGFRGAQTGLAPTELWFPMGHPTDARSERRPLSQLTSRDPGVPVFVRAKPGFSAAQIAGDIRAVLKGQPDPDPGVDALELVPGQRALRVNEMVALAAGILSFSGLVFLAACANLANMLYARGTARAGEIAVRLSLGASTRDILRLFLAEAGIIAFIAAAGGLALAVGATEAFTAAFPTFRLQQNLGVTLDLTPDYRVFFYAFGAGTLAALIIGLLTAWRSGRVPVIRAIGSGTTSSVVSSRRRGLPLTFVSVQITAAVLLLIGAGLFLENTRPALDRRIHYETVRLAAARLIRTRQPGESRAAARKRDWAAFFKLSLNERLRLAAQWQAEDNAEREGFFDALLARARALPGVEAAALTDAFPGGTAPAPRWGKSILQASEAPLNHTGLPRKLDGSWISVSPGFFETIGVKLIRGRTFQPSDGAWPLRAVLSRSAAEGLWPGEDPIGQTINCCQLMSQPITVIGVAEDAASSSDPSPWTRYSNFVFLSATQEGDGQRFIVVRASNPIAQVDAIRALIHELDENAPVFDAGPVDEFLLAGVALQRAQRVLTMSLGLLALGLAMFGVYAVVGYFVSRRTREFGLRLALGAMPRQILKLVVDYAIHIILIGLLPGVFFASLGTRLFENQLFGIMPNGITMWVVAPLIMLAAGVVAGLLPARRAARVDPNVTLREL